ASDVVAIATAVSTRAGRWRVVQITQATPPAKSKRPPAITGHDDDFGGPERLMRSCSMEPGLTLIANERKCEASRAKVKAASAAPGVTRRFPCADTSFAKRFCRGR